MDHARHPDICNIHLTILILITGSKVEHEVGTTKYVFSLARFKPFPLLATPFYLAAADRIGKRMQFLPIDFIFGGPLHTFMGGLTATGRYCRAQSQEFA